MGDRFGGFRAETFSFLADLRDNNEKVWFDANRDRYEKYFLTPAIEFVAGMEKVAASLAPPHKSNPKINGSIRRINRDVRFSKNKSPYQARMHLVFWTGDHPNRSSAIHFVLHPDGIGYGAGQWGLSSEALDNYRQAVCDDRQRAELAKVLDLAGSVGSVLEPASLVRVPRGFEADDSWAGLLKRKSIVARTMDDMAVPQVLMGDGAGDYLGNLFAKLAPLNGWINEALS